MVFKASILDSLGDPYAKVGLSAKFGVVAFIASILDSLGGPLAKVGLSANYEHTSKFTLASQRSFCITYERPISLNYRPLSRLSMDLNVMPKSSKGHKFILCVIDEVTNYLITVPM